MDPVSFLFSYSHAMSHSIRRICRLKLRPNFEIFFVAAIISVSMIIGISAFVPLVQRAKMTHAIGYSFGARMDGILHYAHNGTWPKDNATSLSSGWQQDYLGGAHGFIQEARVVDGAIDFYFSKDLAGQVLTMRHALPGKDANTAIWVCGDRRSEDGWLMIGKDRTTFAPEEINRRLW